MRYDESIAFEQTLNYAMVKVISLGYLQDRNDCFLLPKDAAIPRQGC